MGFNHFLLHVMVHINWKYGVPKAVDGQVILQNQEDMVDIPREL